MRMQSVLVIMRIQRCVTNKWLNSKMLTQKKLTMYLLRSVPRLLKLCLAKSEDMHKGKSSPLAHSQALCAHVGEMTTPGGSRQPLSI